MLKLKIWILEGGIILDRVLDVKTHQFDDGINQDRILRLGVCEEVGVGGASELSVEQLAEDHRLRRICTTTTTNISVRILDET